MNAVDDMTQAALMVALANGRAARRAQDALGDALDGLDKRTIDGILDKLDRGVVVTGQDALVAWQQLLANRRLRRMLERTERAGVVAAVQVKPAMDNQTEKQ